MVDCIFCKIVKGEIPAYKVGEGNLTFSFLDINPVTKGHTLIVPKRHLEDLEELSAQEWAEIARWVNRIGAAAKKALGAKSIMLLRHGELVPHTHFHVIPRYPDDSLQHWSGAKADPEELKKLVGLIKKQL